MLPKIQKKLTIILLFTLAACTLVGPQHPNQPTSFVQPYPIYSPSISYPGPEQSSTAVPSTEPFQQQTQIPSLSPSRLSTPTLQPSQWLRIAQLQMIDTKTGWAVHSAPFIRPEKSKILRTTAGIQTWMIASPLFSENNSNIRAASFVDANTAILISSRSQLPESPIVEIIPWRTTNGGKSWQAGETIQQAEQVSQLYPGQLTFLDPEHGWLLGESDSGMQNIRVHFFETQDGGMNWEMVYDTVDHLTDADTLWIKGYYPFSEHFTFASETAGFFSDGKLFGSQDGGRSWIFRPLDPHADLPDMGCQGSDCKYLDTVSAPRFTSTQDGVLIRRVYLNSDVVMDVFVYYPNTQNRLPLPIAQYLYYTHDGGQTWVPKPLPVLIGTVDFLDAQKGWLLGKSDPDPANSTQLYQTTDGGETWIQTAANCLLPLGSELQFVDEQNGFAFYPFPVSDYYQDFDSRVETAIRNSYIFYTNDSGRSWVQVEPQVIP